MVITYQNFNIHRCFVAWKSKYHEPVQAHRAFRYIGGEISPLSSLTIRNSEDLHQNLNIPIRKVGLREQDPLFRTIPYFSNTGGKWRQDSSNLCLLAWRQWGSFISVLYGHYMNWGLYRCLRTLGSRARQLSFLLLIPLPLIIAARIFVYKSPYLINDPIIAKVNYLGEVVEFLEECLHNSKPSVTRVECRRVKVEADWV